MIAVRLFVFLGAFLLFAMEPMVGRMLLPGFGGAFHVWTTSLMFFQGVLFLGYLYAHRVAPRIGGAHLAVIALPLLALPPRLFAWATGARDVPALLVSLGAASALPFFALSTTTVVASSWLARSALPGREKPYVIYAVSNAGSLLALLGYAVLVEPFVPVSTQRIVWSAGFAIWIVLGVIAWRATRVPGMSNTQAVAKLDAASIPWTRVLYWTLLSALPSAFLMAVTNLIAIDAGNVPLVWILPLGLYLLTFVIAFGETDRVPGMVRRLWPHFAVVGLFLYAGGDTGTTWLQILLHAGVFFVVCLATHAELYASRPDPAHLTLFYLVTSAGGWLGGAFVALLAPNVFTGLFEYPVAVFGILLTFLVYRWADFRAWLRSAGFLAIGVSVALALVIVWKLSDAWTSADHQTRRLDVRRSWYGLYQVLEMRSTEGDETKVIRTLSHGTTVHGKQDLSPGMERVPLSYYHRDAPFGDVMERAQGASDSVRIGIVGLGVGATAAYARPADSITFYEIDPVEIALARQWFRYLDDCEGTLDVVVGDARLSLEDRAREGGPQFDVLLVDAFAGDAIPVHLVTREATELYRQVTADDGVVLFHVSNRFYDLRPVLATIAHELGVIAAMKGRLHRPASGEDPSMYVMLVEREEVLAPYLEDGWERMQAEPGRSAWRDEHANTLSALMPDWE